jgi:hypothetical protein
VEIGVLGFEAKQGEILSETLSQEQARHGSTVYNSSYVGGIDRKIMVQGQPQQKA